MSLDVMTLNRPEDTKQGNWLFFQEDLQILATEDLVQGPAAGTAPRTLLAILSLRPRPDLLVRSDCEALILMMQWV